MEILNLETMSYAAVAVVPIVVALVQAFKMIGLPSKYSPLVAIGVGILVAFIFKSQIDTLAHTILAGVIYGLSASGLYSGVKTTMDVEKQGEQK